jgi:hypothetical protein
MTKRKVLSKREQRKLEDGRKAALTFAGYHWIGGRSDWPSYHDGDGYQIGVAALARRIVGAHLGRAIEPPRLGWQVIITCDRVKRKDRLRIGGFPYRDRKSAMKALEQFAAGRL